MLEAHYVHIIQSMFAFDSVLFAARMEWNGMKCILWVVWFTAIDDNDDDDDKDAENGNGNGDDNIDTQHSTAK